MNCVLDGMYIAVEKYVLIMFGHSSYALSVYLDGV